MIVEVLKSITIFIVAAAATIGLSKLQRTVMTQAAAGSSDPTGSLGARGAMHGAAILLGLVIAVLMFKRNDALSSGDVRWELTLAVAMLVIALVGDAARLGLQAKIALQVVAVGLFAFLGPSYRFLPYFSANAAVMGVWLLLIANAFVLVDGLAGLAPSIGVLASIATAAVALVNGHHLTTIAALAMAGALAGFMLRDFDPISARIGNEGALAIGVVLGLISVHASRDAHATWASRLAIPLLIMMVPLIDTMTVTMRGLVGTSGDEHELDHSYHRLGRLGLTRIQSLIALVALQGGAAAAAVVIAFVPEHEAVMMLPYVALLFAIPVMFLMNQAFDTRADAHENELSGVMRILFAAASRRIVVTVMMDLIIASAAFFGALLLRFEFDVPVATVVKMLATLPGVLIATLLAFAITGIYRSSTSSAGVVEALRFAAASGLAAGLAELASMPNEFVIPRGACLVFAILLFNLLVVTRWSFEVLLRVARNFVGGSQRVVIVGADARGQAAVSHLFSMTTVRTELLGIVDDDDFKRGKLFHGYPVLGSIQELAEIFDRTAFNEILIAQEQLAADQLIALQAFAISHQVSLRRFSLSFTEVGQEAAGASTEMARAS
jgi:UDP-GlcNAc:undecaprenyl-phosphate/decaprenyl-phosphate GlcNAc-1-phosphate transferase